MKIRNFSENIEKPEPIEITSVSGHQSCVRLSVPILNDDGSYKYVGFIVSKEELMDAVDIC